MYETGRRFELSDTKLLKFVHKTESKSIRDKNKNNNNCFSTKKKNVLSEKSVKMFKIIRVRITFKNRVQHYYRQFGNTPVFLC